MNKGKRIITIVCSVDQPTANWLWETHLTGEIKEGIKVLAIGEGNAFKEIGELEETCENLRDNW